MTLSHITRGLCVSASLLALAATPVLAQVQKSGCFSLVDRGASMNAAAAGRQLKDSMGLQSGSIVGIGQIKAADFVLGADDNDNIGWVKNDNLKASQ